MLSFRPVSNDKDLAFLAQIARQIWTGYWPAIIGMDQTQYMLDTLHSEDRMRKDMTELGYRFWLLYDEAGECVGYTGGAAEIMSGDLEKDARILHNQVVQDRWDRRFFISKIYLYPQHRGKHYASRVIEFYEDLCRAENLDVMYLTVNVDNELGIRAYLGRGFETVDKHASPIGNGFVMDDYIMAKVISDS